MTQKNELIQVLLRDHADKLPKWYCDLNCFRIPQGFPIVLDENADDSKKAEDLTYMLALDAVCEALGEEGASRAWWVIELGRTEDAWHEWRTSNRRAFWRGWHRT